MDMREVNMELGNLMFGNSQGEYPIEDRMPWQEAFFEVFGDKFDSYGYYEGREQTDRGGYENDVFVLNPYYWGEDEKIGEEPNFLYKPTGWEIQWYKYPMRDAYQNRDVLLEEAVRIWKKCRASM